jgi:hypothetical protein
MQAPPVVVHDDVDTGTFDVNIFGVGAFDVGAPGPSLLGTWERRVSATSRTAIIGYGFG